MTSYASSSTRWQVIVFDYENQYPTSEKVEEATPVLSNNGVVSLSFNRTKESIQSVASIEVVGQLSDQYRIGNWVILKSKVGTFKNPTEVSQADEGLTRFIGQIVEVVNNSTRLDSGLLHKRSNVIIREWSGILHCPVRLEIGAAEQQAISSNNLAVSSSVSSSFVGPVKQSPSDIVDVVSAAFDPYDYVRLVLAFVGFFGSAFKSVSGPQFSEKQSVTLAKYAETISKSALYLPHIPQSLLDYLGMSNIKPDQAFTSDGGFAGLLLGVNDGSLDPTFTYQKLSTQDENSFNGVFISFDTTRKLYKNYLDRPRTTGMIADFAQGRGAWDIIKSRCDPEFNECFTDIWYFSDPSTEQTSKFVGPGLDITKTDKPIYAKPVVILRDKPFALNKHIQQVNIKGTKFSALDFVPRVFIDNVFIKNISYKSTFYNSPNYIQPTIANDGVSADTYAQKNLLLSSFLKTLRPEMNRFGGIQHWPSTPYIATNGRGDILSDDWFNNITKIELLWNGLNYRFLSGSMTLKDHDIAIMVGCNISFKLPNDVLFCAHVESVSWSFMINADGSVSNDCQVSFSHLTVVGSDGMLDFVPVEMINDIFQQVDQSVFNQDEITLVKDISIASELQESAAAATRNKSNKEAARINKLIKLNERQ